MLNTVLNRDERGQTLILIAIVMTVLIMFTGFIVDVSMLYHDKSQLDAATSLAASSGAANANGGCNTSNAISSLKVTEPGATASASPSGSGCTVTASKTFPIFFNGFLGSAPTITLHSTASSGG